MKNRKKQFLFMLATMFCLSIILTAVIRLPVQAADAIKVPDKITKMEGEGSYIICADNYQLDMEETDLLEVGYTIIHGLNNFFMKVVALLGKMTCILFYQCIEFDIANMFSTQIDVVQGALNVGVFKPLFLLGFCGAAIVIVKNMLRRDLIGIMGQFAKVIGIFLLSVLLVSRSSMVLSSATGMTKSISMQVLTSMQGSGAGKSDSFAAVAAGTLWVNLVHQPWLFVEFNGENVDDDIVDDLLYSDSSDERKEALEDYSGEALNKEYIWSRLAFLFFYLIVMLIKCVIYIVLAIMTLGFQLFAVFYVLLAPVVLILTMFPGYEGVLNSWLKKIIETQLGVLIASFILGLIVMLDNLLYAACSGAWGWLMVIAVQAGSSALIILKRNELLGAIGKLQKATSTPGYGRAMLQRADAGSGMNKTAVSLGARGLKYGAKKGRHIAAVAGTAALSTARKAGDWVDTKEAKALSPGMGGVKGEAVERPVMAARGRKAENTGAKNRADAPASPSEAQREVKRPRMQNRKIIETEVAEGHLRRAEGHELQQPETEQEEKRERPSMKDAGTATQETTKSEDRAASGEEAAGRTAAGRTAAARASVGKETAGRTAAAKASAGRETAGRTAASKTPAGKETVERTAASKTPAGKETVERTAAAKTSAGKETVERTTVPKASAGKTSGGKTVPTQDYAKAGRSGAKTNSVKRPQSSVPSPRERLVSGGGVKR